jgi:hypothetical protein
MHTLMDTSALGIPPTGVDGIGRVSLRRTHCEVSKSRIFAGTGLDGVSEFDKIPGLKRIESLTNPGSDCLEFSKFIVREHHNSNAASR